MADEAPTDDDLDFQIEGPDPDGFVWICSAKGRDVWCRNLGSAERACERFSEWLGSIDYQEHGAD